ncbi:muscarinic acetylcholine receptor M3-like [Strongylocentrotus purpuratus]|uniref:G-protein coupled receptors family 1 profile domain-containing protein n=1 Tax=Strongylocentrotus purpuratus TaxID=7668 RepID=A0A7M7NCX3_STRPU|nr:muscarinic acetylcholine receptor M3-like [Strongylocentrotus purpuratus]
MDANMTNVSDGTQPYTTIMVWTDFQYSSEFVTEANSLDSVKSVSFQQNFTAILVGFIILSNTISLVAFLLEKRLRSYNNYFIINLTILDLLVGIGLCPYVQHIYDGRYPFSHNACKILSGLFHGIVNASNINIVVICADRHQAVYDPINHFISRSTRKDVIINFLPWVIGLSFWIGCVTVWEFAISFDNGDHCFHRIAYSPVTALFQGVFRFYLPILIISILYIRILIKIRKSAGGRNVSKDFASTHLSSSTDTEMTSGSIPSIPHACLDNVDARSDNAIASSSSSPNVTKIGTRGQDLSSLSLSLSRSLSLTFSLLSLSIPDKIV